MPWLINAGQLEKFRKNQKSLIILDASWHMPTDERNAKQEFTEKHIIDAHFFDITSFHDSTNTLPNMLLLDEAKISEKLSALGIRNDYKIILYDNSDHHSACRALWMLKVFGHNPNLLYILDGGIKAWDKFGGKTESGGTILSAKNYTAQLEYTYLCTLGQMKSNLQSPSAQVVDLRHPVRFCGGPEPRPDLRLGHIPGSFSLPYFSLFDSSGHFHPLEKIRKQLSDVAVSLDYPIITTCGSGMTAPILNFLLDLLNHEQHSMYDGAWSEWGVNQLYPHETSMDERPAETFLI